MQQKRYPASSVRHHTSCDFLRVHSIIHRLRASHIYLTFPPCDRSSGNASPQKHLPNRHGSQGRWNEVGMPIVSEGSPCQRLYPYRFVQLTPRCSSSLPAASRLTALPFTDRELFFVPKKGRPVTQCPHCRSERKKRAAHVKCDCGDKSHTKEKCVHLREAEAKAEVALSGDHHSHSHSHTHSPDLNPLPEESSPDDHACCCTHGDKCSCSSLKKEPSEEALDPLPKAQRSKPRLTSHASEGHLTIFANGHHKPCHRNNNAAHESGAPYKLPRAHSHTVAGTSSAAARRSVDSLASVQSAQPVALPQQIVVNTCVNPEHNISQSEQGSPQSTIQTQYSLPTDAKPTAPISQPSYIQSEVSSSLPSTTFHDFGYPSAQSAISVATSTTEASSMPTYSVPTSSMDMGGAMTDYWSNIDWNNIIDNTMDVQPALTNTSSGTMSEIDDLPPVDDMNAFDAPYVANTQAQMPYDLVNNFSGNPDFDVDFGTSTSQPNRWSLPLFSNQNFNTTDDKIQQRTSPKTSGTASPALDAANQPLPMDQFGDFQQYPSTSMSDPTSSAPAQSPMQTSSSEYMYQPRGASVSGYSWDGFLPNYNSAAMSDGGNNDGVFGLPESSSAQIAGNAGTTADFQDATGYGDTYGFDNNSKMLQWNDGTFAPAGQDFLSTYNFDQDFSTPDFNNPWTS